MEPTDLKSNRPAQLRGELVSFGVCESQRGYVRVAAEDAKRRDRNTAAQQDRLTQLTKWLVAFAALTSPLQS